GDLTAQTGIEYIYIMRQKDQDVTEIPGETPLPPQTMPTTQPGDILAPRSMSPIISDVVMLQTQEPGTAPTQPAPRGAEDRIITIEGQPMQIQGGQPVAPPAGMPNEPQVQPMAPASQPSNFQFNDLKEPEDVRVIRVPVEALLNGEMKYNIVIRPRDFIWVP